MRPSNMTINGRHVSSPDSSYRAVSHYLSLLELCYLDYSLEKGAQL